MTEFKYLGGIITSGGNFEKELRTSIALANPSFQRLLPVWKYTEYSLKLKLRLFHSNVMSVRSYAMECLKLTVEQEKRLTTFENNYLYRIL